MNLSEKRLFNPRKFQEGIAMIEIGETLRTKPPVMTGNFVFEEGLMGPFFRVKNAHITVNEDYIPGAWVDWKGWTGVVPGQERILRSDQTMNCHCGMISEGIWGTLMAPPAGETLFWEVQLRAESLGGGFEGIVHTHYEPYVAADPNTYSFSFAVPPPVGGWPEGIWDVVATMKLVCRNGVGTITKKLPFVGFAELGKMETYEVT